MSPEPLASRRIFFRGLSALGVAAALAGCGGEDPPATGGEKSSPAEPTPTEAETSDAETESPDGPGDGPTVLARADEIPVGGGVVLRDQNVVVTQPAAGRFEAFTATCTHEGNPVGVVEDNTITCQYHGSQYDAASGEVTRGPAVNGLTPVKIKVRTGQITRA
ncbi:MAG: Rieske (2Fe-2S) protein [Nocardioides sp.]